MKPDPWEEKLRSEAARLNRDAPEGLDQRIIHAVARSARPPAPPRFAGPAAILFAAACAAVVFYSYQEAAKPVHAPAAPIALAVPAVPVQPEEAAVPITTELLQEDPLQDEADSVYSDARSAVSFLAANFLPATPQKSG